MTTDEYDNRLSNETLRTAMVRMINDRVKLSVVETAKIMMTKAKKDGDNFRAKAIGRLMAEHESTDSIIQEAIRKAKNYRR